MRARWTLTVIPSIALMMTACGGQQEVAESPASKPAAAPSDPAGDAGEADQASKTEDRAPADELPTTPERTAAEILSTEDVAFTLDYNSSAMKKVHEEKCTPLSKGDPAALAKCMENERKRFYSDVLWFRKDNESGEMIWLVYKRQGDKLNEVFRSTFEFADDSSNKVTVKLVGQAKGTQQIFTGQRTIPVQVPTKYGLVIDDPKHGELKYDSKVGLVAAPGSDEE